MRRRSKDLKHARVGLAAALLDLDRARVVNPEDTRPWSQIERYARDLVDLVLTPAERAELGGDELDPVDRWHLARGLIRRQWSGRFGGKRRGSDEAPC